MGFKENSGYCEHCGRVLVRAKTPSYVLHVILVVLTGGVWLIPFFFIMMTSSSYLCTSCGRPAKLASGSSSDTRSDLKSIFGGINWWNYLILLAIAIVMLFIYDTFMYKFVL